MAQIMEFLLNLLLMKGKFLQTTAAETLHVAIKRCLQYKRKISTDYNQATQMINSFENMLEFINYNARHYRCEGKNFIVTNEVRYGLYEQLSGVKQHENTNTTVEDNRKNLSVKETPVKQNTQKALESVDKKNTEIKRQNCKHERESVQEKKKIKNQDYLLENLHAILKSQEFLFKNIIKLVSFLEKDPVFKINNKKLQKIKKKLAACTDVLSNNTSSRNLTDLINNIIEEEITRCRFRHGESKTSAEISIKKSAPRGLEAALETRKPSDGQRDKIKQELKRLKLHKEKKSLEKEKKVAHAINQDCVRRFPDSEIRNEEVFLKRSKSEPIISLQRSNYEDILKKNNIDIDNTKNLIQKNEEHFLKFENTLWHKLTSEKYLSLKDEYTNMCKCAFHNKRHFVAFESMLSNEIKRQEEIENTGKLVTISDTVFQIFERKLVVAEGIPQEYPKIKNSSFTKTLQENPFIKLQQSDIAIVKQQENVDKRSAPNTKKEEKNVEGTTKIKQDLKMPPEEVKKKKVENIAIKATENNETAENRKSEENEITFKKKSVRNQETNTIINGNNLQKCLKLSEEVSEKNKTQLTQKDQKNSERILQIISVNVPTDNFKTEKKLAEKIKDTTSVENRAQISTVDNSSVAAIKAEIKQKLEEPEFKLQVNLVKEPEQKKNLEIQDQDKNQNNKEKISGIQRKSETFALLRRKREENIKDIFLKTIEKEVANLFEYDGKSQEIVKIKPFNIVNKADVVETDQKTGPIKSAATKPEDFLLPLAIAEKNEKKLTCSLTNQENNRNEQESNVIFKSYETEKISKNVSFPIVKNYEDTFTTRKETREMFIAPHPKEDEMRKDQEIKVVALLKENIACISSGNTEKNNRMHSMIEKKLKGPITETSNINTTIKIADSGQQIYERSKKLRKIQESNFRLGVKKVEPTRITVNKQSFHPPVQHPKSKINDQEKKKIEKDERNNNDSLKLVATEKSKKHEPKSAIPRLKVQQKKIDYVKMKKSETMSVQTIANADGKLFSIQGHPSPSTKTRTLSLMQLKNEADLMNMNRKVFDDLEATLRTVRIIMNKQAVLMGSNETLGNRKRKIDEPINKNFSTKPVLAERSRGDSYGIIKGRKVIRSNKSFSTKKITPISGKSKTFLKCVASDNVNSMEEKSPKVEKQLRRTTKTAIKKQQVLTIFPKISKSEVREKPKITPIDINEIKTVMKQKGDGKSVHFGKVKSIPLLKTIYCDPRRRNTYSKKLSDKIECVKCKTDNTKVC